MQLVTIEVCATRIFPVACPAEWLSAIANPAAKNNAQSGALPFRQASQPGR
jgi:hypothetical protein